MENYKVQNGALHTENAQLQVQIKNLQMEKDSDKLKLVMAQKEVTNLSKSILYAHILKYVNGCLDEINRSRASSPRISGQ